MRTGADGWKAADREAVLRRRARALARVEERGRAEGPFLEILEFAIGDEVFGASSTCVRRVEPLRDLTPLPCTPGWVAGVINLQGRIVAVIDLAALLELPRTGITDLSHVVIIAYGDVEAGILASRILGLRRIREASLRPPLPTLAGAAARFVLGTEADGGLILDAERMLSGGNLVVEEEAGGPAGPSA